MISIDLLLVFAIREYVISVNFRVTSSHILFSIWVYLVPVFTFGDMLSLFDLLGSMVRGGGKIDSCRPTFSCAILGFELLSLPFFPFT